MLDLSPTKLLIILVVAVLLLGPKRLPQVARQLGAGWRWLRQLHHQIDQEVRQSIPDLPSSQELVRYARSPVSLLNRLAAMPPDDALVEDPAAPEAGATVEGVVVGEGSNGSARWPEDPLASTVPGGAAPGARDAAAPGARDAAAPGARDGSAPGALDGAAPGAPWIAGRSLGHDVPDDPGMN